jgi:hypothetical protein
MRCSVVAQLFSIPRDDGRFPFGGSAEPAGWRGKPPYPLLSRVRCT